MNYMQWTFKLAPENFLWGYSECTIQDLVLLPQEEKVRLLSALKLHPTHVINHKITSLVRDALIGNVSEDTFWQIVNIDEMPVANNCDQASFWIVQQVLWVIYAEKDFERLGVMEALVGLMNIIKRGIMPSPKLFDLTLANRPLMWGWYMTNSRYNREIISEAWAFFDNWFRETVAILSQEHKDAYNRFMDKLDQSR